MDAATDEAEFSTFVETRWATLFRTAYLLTGERGSAEDLAQETLAKAFTAWNRIVEADSRDAYVHRMLVNSFLSQRRRRSFGQEFLVAEVPERSEFADAGTAVDLWPMVLALPKKQRAVVVLRYYEGLDEREIAEALGCSRGTVKSQAHDALRRLRTDFDEATSQESGVR